MDVINYKAKIKQNRALLIILVMLFSMIGGWLLYSYFGHKFVEAMYEGRSIGFLNKIIKGQAHPLQHYFNQADRLFSVFILGNLCFIILVYFEFFLTSRTIRMFMYWGICFLFIIIYIYIHNRASYSFPIPWTDESFFLYQSISFQKNNSFYAPQINFVRPVLWMPYGYMVFTGVLFKVFGFSFSFARSISLILLIASFIFLALITRKFYLQMLSLMVCGFFFLTPQFIVAGNIARMEGLLLFIVCVAFFLMQMKKMEYKGLILLSISPLVHPNGFYFFISAIAYFALSKRFRHLRLTKADFIFISIAICLWLSYILYISQHWRWFVHDAAFQLNVNNFNRKLPRDVISRLVDKRNMLQLILLVICFIYGLRKKIKAVFLLFIAIPAMMTYKICIHMWYQIFDRLYILLFLIVLLHTILHLVKDVIIIRNKKTILYLFLIYCMSFQSFLYVKNVYASLFSMWPSNYRWGGMHMQSEIPYIKDSDIAELRTFLSSFQSLDHPIYIQFYPEADALFFEDLERKNIRFSQPIFYKKIPDIYIIHLSRYLPGWWADSLQSRIEASGIKLQETKQILYQRDETERWYYNFR